MSGQSTPFSAPKTAPHPVKIIPQVRFSILAKITLPYLLLSMLLISGAAFMMTRVVFDSMEERFNNQLAESGTLLAESMVIEENHLLETVRLLANVDGAAAALQNGDSEMLRTLSFGIAVDHLEEAVEFLDVNGNLVFSMRHKEGGQLEEYEYARGSGDVFTNRPFVQRVMARQHDPSGNKYSGWVNLDSKYYFYVASPVINGEGHLAGAVLVGRSLDSLVRQLRAATLSQVTLYGFDGQVLASTFIEPQPLSKEVSRAVIANQDTASPLRSVNSTQEPTFDDRRSMSVTNIEYTEILGPWEAREQNDLGIFGVALPESFLVSTSQATRLQVAGLASAALLLVLIIGISLASYITNPLRGLLAASRQVAAGDLDVQVKPRSNDEVAVLAEAFNQMVNSLNTSRSELTRAYDSTLEGWSRALELRDKETEGHTLRVAELAVQLAERLGVQGEELTHLHRGALLHDIGKMAVPDAILLKPGPLTHEERLIMQEHPQLAYQMLYSIEHLRQALDIPRFHHERWDGQGYPTGLSGTDIPLAARIFAVVDVWDAITSDRLYRSAMSTTEALEIIRQGSGNHFDPQVVEVFLQILTEYYPEAKA